jgi:hypothetical protein
MGVHQCGHILVDNIPFWSTENIYRNISVFWTNHFGYITKSLRQTLLTKSGGHGDISSQPHEGYLYWLDAMMGLI